MRNDRKLGQVEEVAELSGTYYQDDVLVVVRCFRVGERRGSAGLCRLEVLLEGHGHRAVFDLPSGDEALAPELIDDALRAFVATIRLREGCGGGGSAPAK